MPEIYIINSLVNVRRNEIQVMLISTNNQEIDAGNIRCTLEHLNAELKLARQGRVEDCVRSDHLN